MILEIGAPGTGRIRVL